VAPDDLNTPLGQNKSAQKSALLPVPVAQAIAAGLGLLVLVFILWAAIADNPLGGEPVVVVSADPPAMPEGQKPEATPLGSGFEYLRKWCIDQRITNFRRRSGRKPDQ
jgi:hypothetical protein